MRRSSSNTTVAIVATLLLVTAGTTVGIATAETRATAEATVDGADAALAAQNETATTQNETVPAENATDGGNVTVVNQGENASVGAVAGVSPEDVDLFLGPNATTGPNVTTGPNGTEVNVSQTYVVGGETAGWEGIAPASIDGTENPALNMTAGELYAITWYNLDGAPHNVAITDSSGNVIAETPIISGEGGAQTLVFRAPPDTDTYYCVVHPSSMRADIVLQMNATGTSNATASA